MRLLIAYDGSRSSEAAIDDLYRCGLPPDGQAEIIAVAEVWLPPPDEMSPDGDDTLSDPLPYVDELTDKFREHGQRVLSEAEIFARHARTRVQSAFPDWDVTSTATYGSPAWEILNRADEVLPDLIVVGSQGHSAVSRFMLGSISQKVLTEARCSVRVARGRIDVDPAPQRVVIGFDGSKGAEAAVDAAVSRNWQFGTEIRLIAVSDPITPTAIGRFLPPVTRVINDINVSENRFLEKRAEKALKKLEAAGLSAELRIYPGNPKTILVEEAENWSADCIFVGANSQGSNLARFLIGSTSAAVAARAKCSVEVIRKQQTPSSPTETNGSDGATR